MRPSLLWDLPGHGIYSQTFSTGSYTNMRVAHFDPPFNNSSLPTATIAAPKPGDRVQDLLMVSGTAGDTAALVTAVDIFIDSVQRARVVPSGSPLTWTTTLNLPALGIAPGDHRLTIRVTNGRGGFSDLPATPIVFTMDPGNSLAPVVAIDKPADGDTVQGRFAVSGYAYVAGLRISSVDTLIDGLVYPVTSYGLSRKDVCDPLAAPKPANCPQVGFAGTFSTVETNPPVPDGPHQLQVRVRDQTGRFTFFPATPLNITVANGAPAKIVGVLESPATNETLTGTVTISGYVYSPGRKITSGLVYVDGTSAGTLRLAQPRPDVCANLPDADACPDIGFMLTVNTARFLNGPHVLGVRVTNDRGDTLTFPRLVNGGINVFVHN